MPRLSVEDLVDPCIAVPPSPRVLNRVLLVCLRCIDADAHKRPKMGQIVHMLEGDEFPFRMVLLSSVLFARRCRWLPVVSLRMALVVVLTV